MILCYAGIQRKKATAAPKEEALTEDGGKVPGVAYNGRWWKSMEKSLSTKNSGRRDQVRNAFTAQLI